MLCLRGQTPPTSEVSDRHTKTWKRCSLMRTHVHAPLCRRGSWRRWSGKESLREVNGWNRGWIQRQNAASFSYSFVGWGSSYYFTFYIEFTNSFLVFLQMVTAQGCGGSGQESWGEFLEGVCVPQQIPTPI